MTGVLTALSSPAELIDGNPHAARQWATTLRTRGYLYEDLGHALIGIDHSAFRSGAAADRFPATTQHLATALGGAAQEYLRASYALDRYADTVEEARLRAAVAIDTWVTADRLSATAAATRSRTQRAASTGPDTLPAASSRPAPLPSSLDPGAPLREEATLQLVRARRLAEEAGDEAAAAVDSVAGELSTAPGFWDRVGGGWSDLWHGATDLGAGIGNGVMSFGNALVQHPDLLAELVGGLLLMQGGIALGAGGLALNATGVGAIVGVPADAAAAAAIAAGAALAGQAATRAAIQAAGEDGVHLFEGQGGGGSGFRSPDAVPEDYPRAVTGYTNHSVERMVQRHSWRQRVEELVDSPPETPTWQPDHQTWLYEGNDGLTVTVNEFGEVVTVYGG